MATTAYKNKLIEKIKSTDDKAILKEVEKSLSTVFSEAAYKLSSAEKAALAQNEKDIQSGAILTTEAAQQERRKWLSK